MPLKVHFITFQEHEATLIPDSVKRSLRRFARGLEASTRVPHKVEVQVIPAACLTGDNKDLNCGHFFLDDRGNPVIQIAGAKTWQTKEGREAGMHDLKDTLAHELAHYEQFRDGRDYTSERGVRVRARTLHRKAEEQG